jgi:hypothetical protein
MSYGQEDIMVHLIRNRFYTYCRQEEFSLAEEMRNIADAQDLHELVYEFDEYLSENRTRYQHTA